MKIVVPMTLDIDVDMIIDWIDSCDDNDVSMKELIEEYIYNEMYSYDDILQPNEKIIIEKIEKEIKKHLTNNK